MSRRALPATILALTVLVQVGCASEEARRGALAPFSAALETFDPRDGRDDAAFAQLNTLVLETPRLAARAAVSRTTVDRHLPRLAAVYVLGLTAREADEVAALREALTDPVPDLRAIAAGSLIGLGEKRAIPVLIQTLRTTINLPYSSVAAADHALAALRTYTDQDLGGDPDAWRDWWEAEEADLRWDDAAKRFTA